MRQVKRLLPYVRRYVQMARLRRAGRGGGGIPERGKRRRWSPGFPVYGNVSTFSLSTEIQDVGTGLTVSMREPCPACRPRERNGR